MRTKPLYCLHYTRLSFKMLCKNGNSISVIQWVWDYPQNIKTGRFGSQPERSVFPVWVLTGFACYSARKSRLTYAGLLACQECGNSFSPMIRCWNGKSRVEYVCRGYHRNGKAYCASHRIHEEVLDEAVWDYTEKLREQYAAELKKVTQLQKQWAPRKPVLDAHCLTLQKEILRLEQEVDALVMEKLKGNGGSSAHEIGT
jgi:hypothetical protein